MRRRPRCVTPHPTPAMPPPISSLSSGSNPFAGPDMALIRDLNIADRVPVILDQTTASYSSWKRYFSLVFREFLLHSHVDGSVDSRLMVNDEEWMIIDATIIRWFYLTISDRKSTRLNSSHAQ